jgi:hypothetical protein
MTQETTMARPIANEEALTVRMIFPVTPTMAEEIKEYWHAKRLNSKAEAIRALVQAGLNGWKGKR